MRNATPPSHVYRFGDFALDRETGELRKNGIKLKIQGQPLEILGMLLERPGQLVTREELKKKLWPADTFVDFETGLNAAVKRLRDALRDTAENPKYIETLPRHGYRLVKGTVPEEIQLQPAYPLPKKWGPWILGAILSVALVLFFLDARGLLGKRILLPDSQMQIHSLAVLPLTNTSGDPKQEDFADGMTDELISELSRIGSLRVISRTSVMQYKGEKKKSLPQIGRELNADAVVEGSVLRVGNRIRVATHMIHAPTDRSLMAETYEGDLGDVLKMQREVAESIATKVRAKLTPEEQSRLHEAPKVDPEAYQAYEAASNVNSPGYQGLKRARSYLEKSIEKDPNFAPAYVSLAVSYVLAADRWESSGEAYPVAKKFIHRALELDEKDCRAHGALSEISWRYDWDWQSSEKELRRGVELCPNETGLHWHYGAYMALNGRIAEARSEMAKARELDAIRAEPFDGEAVIGYHSRDFKALIEIDRAFVEEEPNNWLAHYWLGVGYEGSGQTLQAITEYQRAIALSADNADPIAALGHAYGTLGKNMEAQKILNQLVRQSKASYVSPYMIATIYAGLGNKNKAFEYLEKAYRERSGDLSYFLRADLRLDGLRSDPRLKDLLSRMNFPTRSVNFR